MKHLEKLPVLESWAGTMEKASSLKYVPLDLRANEEMEPFTLSARTATNYLSSKYPTWIVEGAKSIGISQLSPQNFLEDLQSMITHDPYSFRTKSAQWHSQLAEALVKLTTNAELLSTMQSICLIPLHDGTWTSAIGHSILFSRGGESLDIPSGINVLIIDSSAESDANRRKLFVALGVKSWETPEICRLILKLHQSMNFDSTALTTEQLVSHTAFLYQASWQPPKDADIWFATVQDRRCVGRKLYITGSIESDSPAFRVFAQLQKQFAVIHGGYLEAYPSDVDWPLWLVNNLGLSMVPRLITPLIEPKPRPVYKAPRHSPTISPRLIPQQMPPQYFPEGFNSKSNMNNDLQHMQEAGSPPEINIDFAPPSRQASFEAPKTGSLADALRGTVSSPDRDRYLDPGSQAQEGHSKVGERAEVGHALVTDAGFERLHANGSPRSTMVKASDIDGHVFTGDASPFSHLGKFPYGPPPSAKSHALRDSEMQLMLLEQQNKKRLLMARQEQASFQSASGMSSSSRPDADPHKKTSSLAKTHELPDYHSQLMLLEQQNKQRLLMARQEQSRFPPPTKMKPLPDVLSPLKGSTPFAGEQDQENTSAEDISSSAGDDAKTIFTVSEEFLLMFRECDSSDVLQILRDNWHHYSQWVDGAHMEWQDPDFVVSSTLLKSRLGSSLVQSAKGILPLQELVLPTIDSRLDERRSIPAVRIMDPQHNNWNFLNFFGVLIKADAHYYLRCLISISGEQCPDIDDVGYIYEKIQAFYKGNAEIIRYADIMYSFSEVLRMTRAAFYERDVILTYAKSPSSSKLASWTNMKDCLAKRLAVESQYPSSSYLFRCLSSPSGDPIASIVASATLITTSSRLEDISRLFSAINKALKDVNASQAAELLRPLHRLSIFPVTDGLGDCAYDRLASMYDDSWFIADRPLLRKSFHGKVPLLALSVEDLATSKDMLHVLRLDDRLMSKSATIQAHPVGRVTTHWALSASLRAKSPFIKAYVLLYGYQSSATILLIHGRLG